MQGIELRRESPLTNLLLLNGLGELTPESQVNLRKRKNFRMLGEIAGGEKGSGDFTMEMSSMKMLKCLPLLTRSSRILIETISLWVMSSEASN